MSFCLGEIEAVEYTFGIGIPDRRTFTGHIRKEDHAITSCRNYLSDLIEQLQRTLALLFANKPFISAELSLQPAHHSAAACSTALQQPAIRNYVITKDQPGIPLRVVRTDTHTTGLSALFLGLTHMKYTGSQCTAGCV